MEGSINRQTSKSMSKFWIAQKNSTREELSIRIRSRSSRRIEWLWWWKKMGCHLRRQRLLCVRQVSWRLMRGRLRDVPLLSSIMSVRACMRLRHERTENRFTVWVRPMARLAQFKCIAARKVSSTSMTSFATKTTTIPTHKTITIRTPLSTSSTPNQTTKMQLRD